MVILKNKSSIIVLFYVILLIFTGSNCKQNKDEKDTVQSIEQEYVYSFDEIKNDYMNSYKNIINFDSTINHKGDLINLKLAHYCLKDSAIKVPVQYLEDDQIFITHNFESHIVISKNQRVLIDAVLSKRLFDSILSEEFKEHAVLLKPYLSTYKNDNDFIEIGYSISIPLTDLGRGVMVRINLNNKNMQIQELI